MDTPSKHYHLESLKNMVGDNPDAMSNFIQMFRNNTEINLEDLKQKLAAEDYPNVGKIAHKLKSSIDLLGVEEIKQTIRTIEQNGKNEENVELIPGMVKKVSRVLHAVYDEIKEDFNIIRTE